MGTIRAHNGGQGNHSPSPTTSITSTIIPYPHHQQYQHHPPLSQFSIIFKERSNRCNMYWRCDAICRFICSSVILFLVMVTRGCVVDVPRHCISADRSIRSTVSSMIPRIPTRFTYASRVRSSQRNMSIWIWDASRGFHWRPGPEHCPPGIH